MILGPEEGMRKAEEMNLIARFCSRKETERNGRTQPRGDDFTLRSNHNYP